jgi:hypothetical protein
MYDDIAHGTRCKFETNRPRAVLFEGPPGESLHRTCTLDGKPFSYISCVLHCSLMLGPTVA